MLPVPANMPPRFKPVADLCAGVYVTTDELAGRRRVSIGTLANNRSNGTGTPCVTLPGKKVLYRLSEVLAEEIAGMRGPFSIDRMALELSVMADVPEKLSLRIIDHMRKVMAGGG